jgi:hypothetical protein
MNPATSEIENLLKLQIGEHRRLLAQVTLQRDAMKRMDLAALDAATRAQEQIRTRLVQLEVRCRHAALALARSLRIAGDPTVSALAAALPQQAPALVALRDELRSLIEQIQAASHVATRVAGAVMGHLNTAVRLIGGAVQNAGVYTRAGTASAAPRVGVMEAVG